MAGPTRVQGGPHGPSPPGAHEGAAHKGTGGSHGPCPRGPRSGAMKGVCYELGVTPTRRCSSCKRQCQRQGEMQMLCFALHCLAFSAVLCIACFALLCFAVLCSALNFFALLCFAWRVSLVTESLYIKFDTSTDSKNFVLLCVALRCIAVLCFASLSLLCFDLL